MATFYTRPEITLRRQEQPDILSRFIQLQQLADDRRFNTLREREALLRLKELERQAIEAEAMRQSFAAGAQPGFEPSTGRMPEVPGLEGLGASPMAPREPRTPQSAILAKLQELSPHQVPGVEAQFATQEAAQQKARLDMAKDIASLTKTQLENASTRVNLMAQMADSVVRSPETYPQVRAAAVEQGFISPDQWPEQLTPELLPRLEAVRQQSKEIREAVERERHNRATEVPEAERSFKSFYQTWLEARGAKPNAALELEVRKEFAQQKTSRLLTPEEEAQQKRIAATRAVPESEEDVDTYANNLAAGRINTTDVPARIRGKVLAAVEKAGNIVVPKPIRQTLEQMDKAEGIIDIIETNYNALERAAGPEALAGGTLDTILAKLQANPDAQMMRTQIGLLGNLARSISAERGVLTDRDVERAMQLLPQLTDRADVAKRKISQLRSFIQNARRAATSSMNKKFPAMGGTQPQPTQPKVDPLGLR